MSSRRDLRGGDVRGITARRQYKSSRNRPSDRSSSSEQFVAATILTSKWIALLCPTRVIVWSWRKRRSFGCIVSAISPTSSRNSVPVWDSSSRPILLETACVKAPRSCPKSSLSNKASGMAAQLTTTNGRAARAPQAWIARAISSFPVPLSPRISAEASEHATRRARANNSWSFRDPPTMVSSHRPGDLSGAPGVGCSAPGGAHRRAARDGPPDVGKSVLSSENRRTSSRVIALPRPISRPPHWLGTASDRATTTIQ